MDVDALALRLFQASSTVSSLEVSFPFFKLKSGGSNTVKLTRPKETPLPPSGLEMN